jgi:L-alanine-DL-glutamate epimerase-like enolase superfamily enzyme
MEAIAGMDIAVWSAKAQALGVPLYQALGAVRESDAVLVDFPPVDLPACPTGAAECRSAKARRGQQGNHIP